MKEVLAAVDTRVNEKEKRRRLEDVHARMESKSITRMRSGQMFAREDLIRGRRLLREGALQLKNSQGRMKGEEEEEQEEEEEEEREEEEGEEEEEEREKEREEE